jgi:regulation of enolase protein 1 (concanavalin A-like superfamily)
MVLFKPDSDFVLAARVSGNLKNVYDVAALVIFQDDNCWAKLYYENLVAKEATIVSVITKDYSDDCNSAKADGAGAFLAIEKKGPELSFHYSRDGRTWALTRHFRLELRDEFKIGFTVHGSRGDGFAASFSDIVYSTMPSQNLRQLEIIVMPSSS